MDEFTVKKLSRHIERIDRTLFSMDKTLALQEQSLREHIKRTNLLEQKLEPIEKHVEQVNGAGKLIAILALLATIATGLIVFL